MQKGGEVVDFRGLRLLDQLGKALIRIVGRHDRAKYVPVALRHCRASRDVDEWARRSAVGIRGCERDGE